MLFLRSLALVIAVCHARDSLADQVDDILSNAPYSAAGREFLGQSDAYQKDEPQDITPKHMSQYDFIVVGAGSAGAVVASRLSEIPNFKVLLIEAGGNEHFVMDIPLIAQSLQLRDINWNYTTEPSDSYCLGMKERRCLYPRGKVMGGSSVLNYMAATRGSSFIYDKWAEMGNTDWSYAKVLPYFQKLENMTIPQFRHDKDLHGTNGPVKISLLSFHTNLGKSFMTATRQMGHRTNYDLNSGNENGFTNLTQLNTVKGRRISSNTAYLHPARNRGNLFVTKHSLAKRILICRKTKRAHGVEFIKGNKTIIVHARREIILSAGVFGSPQLLMLSGIGPKKHLSDIGIRLIRDAPVGENFMDHVGYPGLVFLMNQTMDVDFEEALKPSSQYFEDYVKRGSGPLTIPNTYEVTGFFNVDSPLNPNKHPEAEITFLSTTISANSQSKLLLGLTDSLWSKTFQSIVGKSSWNLTPTMLSPKSRGKILLSDKNIKSHPKIIPNFFSHKDDITNLVKAIRWAIKISETRPMQKYGSQLYNAPLPGCENHKFNSDGYWECAVRTLTSAIGHPSGTCKMGPKGDSTAVVNQKLQVNGVTGLRVVDASIFPLIPDGHTNIPVMMTAEKLSDIIKKDYGY